MNKKLMILIVALECVFSVFLISIFGPMIEALHSKIVVEDVYFVDEAGVRMENESSVFVDTSPETGKRSFHLSYAVVTEEATDRTVEIIHNRDSDEIEIVEDDEGFGFTVRYRDRSITSVRITIRAKDSSQKEAVITLIKKDTDQDLGEDFGS